MRTARKVLDELYGTKKDMYLGTYTLAEKQVEDAMKAYAIEVIDHILTRPDMIYVSGEEGADVYGDAVYDYDKFTLLKQQL